MAIKFYKGTWDDYKDLGIIETTKVKEIRIDEKTGYLYYILEDKKDKELSVFDIDIDFLNNL